MTKEEVSTLVGESKWTAPKLINLKYLSGIPIFEKPGLVNVTLHPNGISFSRVEGFHQNHAAVTSAAIEKITMETREKIAAKKSTLGRAIIGGALLGPLGAAAGAISAKKGAATETDFFLSIQIAGNERDALFHLDQKMAKKSEEFFKAHFPQKYVLA